jgi:CheY-like chemotaxis protein
VPGRLRGRRTRGDRRSIWRRAELSVLVVEDNRDTREQLRELLQRSGFRADVAADGSQAVCDVVRRRPVALMDLVLPIVDGWDAIRHIRTAPIGIQPYIIVVSALDDAEARRVAFLAGCNEYGKAIQRSGSSQGLPRSGSGDRSDKRGALTPGAVRELASAKGRSAR